MEIKVIKIIKAFFFKRYSVMWKNHLCAKAACYNKWFEE